MNAVRKEHGMTLIEVLAAMTILAIILLSLMNIFPQMGMMNKHNDDKTQAVNLAKQYLNVWKSKKQIPSNYIEKKEGFYFYEETDPEHRDFVVIIKIKATPDSTTVNSHQIHIQIQNKSGTVLSETYGYLIAK